MRILGEQNRTARTSVICIFLALQTKAQREGLLYFCNEEEEQSTKEKCAILKLFLQHFDTLLVFCLLSRQD